MAITGQCGCGGVRFTLDSAKGKGACHCGVCRRTSGGVYIEWVTKRPESSALELADGVTLTELQTSSYLTRKSCSRCGASVVNRAALDNGYVGDNWMAALLDDPGAVPRTHHIYYADRIVDVDDGLPKFDAYGRPKK